MKTKFIGTVNGTDYDNVNDYNAALTNALQTGAPVDASSQTYSVPDDEDSESDDPEIYEKVFADYDLDELNGTSDEEYIKNFKDTYNDALVDEVAKKLANDKDIIKVLQGDIEETLEVKDININTLEDLSSEAEMLKNKIETLNKKLQDKNQQINICKNAAEIINHSIEYKNKLLKKLGENPLYDLKRGYRVGGRVAKPEKVSDPITSVDEALNGLEKLFKEIWS